MRQEIVRKASGLWERYLTALDEVADHMNQINCTLTDAPVPYTLAAGLRHLDGDKATCGHLHNQRCGHTPTST